jgi:fructosamine-3-kinase
VSLIETEIRSLLESLKAPVKSVINLPSGYSVFVKYDTLAAPGFFEAEVNSLSLLQSTGQIKVPQVLYFDQNTIVLEYIVSRQPTKELAEQFGIQLAKLHKRCDEPYGAPWQGFIGGLCLDNTESYSYPEFVTYTKINPYVESALKKRLLAMEDVAILKKCTEVFADHFEEPRPCVVHGDLWNGNIIWSDEVYLIDPASHVGEAELDLAMLNLFGCPYLDVILNSYWKINKPSDDQNARIYFHQLFYLLIHLILFGKGYYSRLIETANRYLSYF